MELIILCLIPFVICVCGYMLFHQHVTAREYLLLQAIPLLLVGILWMGGTYGSLRDTEMWNGRITEKIHHDMSCCHCWIECDTCTDSKGQSYQCNCRVVCLHTYDEYWGVRVSTGDTVTISMCDSPGSSPPVAWESATIGEPASVQKAFDNYFLVDKESLLNAFPESESDYLELVPDFPEVHSHYKTKKVLTVGVPEPKGWVQQLNEINADLGAKKRVDIIVILTYHDNPKFAEAVDAKWVHGKKNSLIVVLGVGIDSIKWARAITISRVEDLKIQLRDGLPRMKLTDDVIGYIGKAVEEKFTKTSMAEFEYLAEGIRPSDGWLIFMFVFVTVISVAGMFLAANYDIFSEGFYE